MSELKHPLIEEAYQSAQRCYLEANATAASLDEALTALEEAAPEMREALTASLLKAEQLIDHCDAMVQDIRHLRLTYCAAQSSSGLPPDLDLLKETLAGIAQRRASRKQPPPTEKP